MPRDHKIVYLKLSDKCLQQITDGHDIVYQDLICRTDSIHGTINSNFTIDGEYENTSKEIISHEKKK